MYRRTLPLALAALTVALAAPAQAAPPMTDQVMLWQVYQLEPTSGNRNDLFVYYTKQYWVSPQVGIYTFYNTSQSATVRAMYKFDLGDTGISATTMGGLRMVGLGNSAAKPNATFKEGPEVALNVAKNFGGGFSINALGSYARLWGPNSGGAEPGNLYFYGANLNQKVAPATTLSVGVLGSMLGGAASDKLTFHNFGPTLSLTQSF